MYTEILSSIHNITIYPMIGIFIFFIFFIFVVIWAYFNLSKDEAQRIALAVCEEEQEGKRDV